MKVQFTENPFLYPYKLVEWAFRRTSVTQEWKKYIIEPCALRKGNQHRLDQIMKTTQAELCFDCVMGVSHT